MPISEYLLEHHSGEMLILILSALVLGTLLVLVPQLLRAHQRSLEMQHAERMKALEAGKDPPPHDDRAWAAGRTAFLVPMVVICACGTVTCFLAAYRSEGLFSVSLSVWAVGGVVSLAAITGGVALLGRIVGIEAGIGEEEEDSGSGVRSQGSGP